MRVTAFVLSLALVVWAAAAVPLPYEQTVPGSARPIEELVTVGADVDDVNGDLAMLTIRRRDVTTVDAVVAAVRPGQQLTPVDQRVPAGMDQQVFREILAQQFSNSFTTAVAVAADRAGYEVDVRTEVVVTQVLPDGAAAGLLEAGDRITAIDGTPVESAQALVAELEPLGVGDTVTLRVVRDGETVEVPVELALLPGSDRPGIGILPSTLTAPVELPFDVQLENANIVGPSAGLMIAVAVTDLLLEEDLAAGRVVVGTGTIDGTGLVGSIGSIDLKVEAAIDAGADLMLVPRVQAQEAVAAADGRIEVVPVNTVDEALDVLRGDVVELD